MEKTHSRSTAAFLCGFCFNMTQSESGVPVGAVAMAAANVPYSDRKLTAMMTTTLKDKNDKFET